MPCIRYTSLRVLAAALSRIFVSPHCARIACRSEVGANTHRSGTPVVLSTVHSFVELEDPSGEIEALRS